MIESEKGFLDRDKMIKAAKPIIDIASPMLVEIVNYMTNVLAKLLENAKGGDEILAAHGSYLHLIEMMDAFEVQISQAVVEPAMVSLRSAFEALLALNYVLEKDSEYLNRALAYVAVDIHNRIGIYKELDINTQQGKELQAAISSDRLGSSMKYPSIPDLTNRISILENLLKRAPYDVIEAEYQRTKKLFNRKPEWYSLFNGPRNLEKLSEELHLKGTYRILYPGWSKMTHGSGTIQRKLMKGPDGLPALVGLRNIAEMASTIQIGASFCFEGTRIILIKYLPTEESAFNKWYMNNIRESFRKL